MKTEQVPFYGRGIDATEKVRTTNNRVAAILPLLRNTDDSAKWVHEVATSTAQNHRCHPGP